eukprot:361106-Chlamydomonas_euryale.AAC.1
MEGVGDGRCGKGTGAGSTHDAEDVTSWRVWEMDGVGKGQAQGVGDGRCGKGTGAGSTHDAEDVTLWRVWEMDGVEKGQAQVACIRHGA